MSFNVARSAWRNRYLIWQLTKREIVGRYRGSALGMAWSLISPLLMLSVYTFVFAIVFRARWGENEADSQSSFAIVLFAGLIVNNFFAECVNRAPALLLQNVNYVKKVVFPLEILPIVAAFSAFFHFLVSLFVLLIAELVLLHSLPWTVLLLPFLVVPLVLGTVGISWLLSSLGVYLRDIVHVTGLLTTVLLFMSPVFYPISAIPESLRPWLLLNPLTFILEASRGLLIFGQVPSATSLAIYWLGGLIVAALGLWWFQRARRGFADVL